MAFLGLPSAALATPGPPVTSSKRMPGWLNSSLAVSRVGVSTAATKLAGPPAATMARLIKPTANMETLRPAGCTLKTTELPAATMQMALLTIVGTGCVDGVTAPTTP